MHHGLRPSAFPVCADSFQQLERADDVRLNEFARPVYGAIDVGFGCEIENGPGSMLCQQAADQFSVTNIPCTS